MKLEIRIAHDLTIAYSTTDIELLMSIIGSHILLIINLGPYVMLMLDILFNIMTKRNWDAVLTQT
jgi:hypothetical protein